MAGREEPGHVHLSCDLYFWQEEASSRRNCLLLGSSINVPGQIIALCFSGLPCFAFTDSDNQASLCLHNSSINSLHLIEVGLCFLAGALHTDNFKWIYVIVLSSDIH